MECFRCDLCGDFYEKPIKPDTMFELTYCDIMDYDAETMQICKCCLDDILEYIDKIKK